MQQSPSHRLTNENKTLLMVKVYCSCSAIGKIKTFAFTVLEQNHLIHQNACLIGESDWKQSRYGIYMFIHHHNNCADFELASSGTKRLSSVNCNFVYISEIKRIYPLYKLILTTYSPTVRSSNPSWFGGNIATYTLSNSTSIPILSVEYKLCITTKSV